MAKTYIVVNHMQSSYTNYIKDSGELQDRVNQFVDAARPFVDGVIWSYAQKPDSRTGKPFSFDAEKLASFKPGDVVLTNNDGAGRDSGFLLNLSKLNPGMVILAGTYYDACSHATASTIRESGIKTAVPRDLGNKPEDDFDRQTHRSAYRAMHDAGIDVESDSQQLLQRLRQARPGGTRPDGAQPA